MRTLCVFILLAMANSGYTAAVGIPPAYHRIAADYQIPVDVFYSVMLQESGRTIASTSPGANTKTRRYLPWPWVLNVELKPYFFESQERAAIALKQFLAVDKNARIAVGLGQIYLPSHGHLFDDKTVLLNPKENLQYAAKLLADEFQWTVKQSKPNWWIAVGRYHTPSNVSLAKEYREGVYRRCLKISELCTRYGAI